ncbi:MAG TPA: alpha/beta fold hydrolase [Steroidobacter sp.]|jgi:phospholipase/carboxylesterase|nr:alpha/beta fold hydrolase [Steroidobacter sp.]
MTHSTHQSPEAVTLTPAATPTASVIWLHGLGADGFDFAPIVQELRLPNSLPIRFVFPHAKMRPVTINNGYVMRAWYDIAGLGPDAPEDAAGIRESAEAVARHIRAEAAAGVPERRIIVGGFSQGGAVALHAALRHPKRLAGVLALSTYLPLRHALCTEASTENRDAPILMCHGLRDGIVPAALGQASRDFLGSQGYAVEWHSYPMEHQVCLEELADISAWLKGLLTRCEHSNLHP